MRPGKWLTPLGSSLRAYKTRLEQLFAAGLPSRSVREVLPCVDSGTVPPGLLDHPETERARISRRIIDLLAARDRLDDVDRQHAEPSS